MTRYLLERVAKLAKALEFKQYFRIVVPKPQILDIIVMLLEGGISKFIEITLLIALYEV